MNSLLAGGVQSQSTALLTACVEVDLRVRRDDPGRYVRHALDGIRPGDVLKIVVDRSSDTTSILHATLTGVRVQLVAEDVTTRRRWEAVLAAVIA